jgi:GNAT superfamily N-acetyltransferase
MAGAGEANRLAMERHIDDGNVPGVLAYVDGEPAGWCSVAPRASLVGLHAMGSFRNPLRPDVWSVSCFYVPESRRGQGIARGLLVAAVEHAKVNGAKIIEGYPQTPDANDDGAAGATTTFAAAGFEEVATLGKYARVMRLSV